ncbi:MAG: hypothetical protein NC408_03005 [Candidatus Gastranaerophilales bacterium]|nr:hypothetical protein [Candidatus Gastranaerophilales bacterium]
MKKTIFVYIFIFIFMLLFRSVGFEVAFYFSAIITAIIFYFYYLFTGAYTSSQKLNEILQEAGKMHIVEQRRYIGPDGLDLENSFCSVRIDTKSKICYIKEKPLFQADGYYTCKIKNSYKTPDFWGAIIDVFEERTRYEHLIQLALMFDVDYIETFTICEPHKEDNPTMPVLKTDIPQPTSEKIDKVSEIDYNDEREVDL